MINLHEGYVVKLGFQLAIPGPAVIHAMEHRTIYTELQPMSERVLKGKAQQFNDNLAVFVTKFLFFFFFFF